MIRALVLVLAACGSSPREPLPPVMATGSATPMQAAPEAPSTGTVVGFAARTRMIESRHGGEIKTLAVTADGMAVLSVDELGGTRLWPTLDGKVEPRVVDLPLGRSLAIGRDPRGFVVASIDEAGGLTIAVVDRDGLILQRASLAPEPAFVDLAMTSRGLLASRADHTVVRIGTDGAIDERLAVASGERIAALAARGDKLVVQIDGAKRRLRWLVVAPSLQWGDWIASKVEPEGIIAVSPRGTSIALGVGDILQRTLVVIDSATGAPIHGESIAQQKPFDFAFVDELHLVVGALGATRLIAAAKNAVTVPPSAPNTDEVRVLVGGADRVIGPASAELAITSKAGKEYLGYEIEAPTVAAPTTDGNLVIGVGSTFVQLDATLAIVSAPDFKLPALASVAELRHVDGTAWLVEWASLETGRTTTALVDLATGARQDLSVDRNQVEAIGYDARSQLATLSLGETTEVLRYDAAKKKLSRVASLKHTADVQISLTPLAPALAEGSEVVVGEIDQRLKLRWVRAARELDKGKTIILEGTLSAVDPTGTAYVWQRDEGGFATVIVRDGKQVAKLRADRPFALSPDPAGKRFVQISPQEIALVAHDGSRAWALPVPGVNEVQWLTDGSLALLGPGGLARVDAATGAVQAARCGWRFGLSKTQHRSSSHVEPLCTQLR
jgi:hypothetical protein